MSDSKVRKLISRTIEGVETLVNTDPGELFIDVPATDPRYIRVEEGDTVREGDIRSRAEEELESPSLRKWTIATIGRKTVVGIDQETGERQEWDREALEKKLAVGEFSATLTGFDRVNVAGESNREERSGEETATVAVYGNDGRKFVQTYRLVDDAGGDGRRVELTETDEYVGKVEPELQEEFDRAVEHALRNEGYVV